MVAQALFTSPEEQLFIRYLTGAEPSGPIAGIDWEKLFLSYPTEYLYSEAHNLALPASVITSLKKHSVICLHHNQKRLVMIRRIAAMANGANIPVLFVKGAAEIAENAQNNIYMCSRSMGDIDLICHSEHIGQMHRLLTEAGNCFYDCNLSDAFDGDTQAMEQYLVTKTGHLMYNVHSETDTIELHTDVTNRSDLSSYPPDFIDALWQDARAVNVGGVDLYIPLVEHMVVHSLCHAASPKNNLFFWEWHLHQRIQAIGDYINFNVGRYQLMALCQLRLMLANYPEFDRNKVDKLLATVHNPLLHDYVALASYYLKNLNLKEGITPQMLLAARRRNIYTQFLQQYSHYMTVGFIQKYFHGKARTWINRVLLRTCGRFV